MTIFRREKDVSQQIIYYKVYLIMFNVSFSQNTDDFVLVSAKFLQVPQFSFTFSHIIKMVLGLLKWL